VKERRFTEEQRFARDGGKEIGDKRKVSRSRYEIADWTTYYLSAAQGVVAASEARPLPR
jgi:hypothetical protein